MIDFSKNKKWKLIIVLNILAISILVLLIYFLQNSFRKPQGGSIDLGLDKQVKEEIKCLDCLPRLIDGVMVKPGEEKLPVSAVVFDNHMDARPQVGLAKANLVYETKAEGGITRYLGLYASNENIEKIGPVRSARPYFLDWLSEFSSAFVHVGGSPDALALVAKNKILDMNQFYNGNYFYRDKNISAPHNVFTSSDKIKEYIVKKNPKSFEYSSWKYKEAEIATSTAKNIHVGFKLGYEVDWKFLSAEKKYQRFLDDEKHLDGDGADIKFNNIIIMKTTSEVLDEKLRLDVKTLGEGKAVCCFDGKCVDGKWVKKSRTERTKFYDLNNQEIIFNIGATWIEVVDQSVEVAIK